MVRNREWRKGGRGGVYVTIEGYSCVAQGSRVR